MWNWIGKSQGAEVEFIIQGEPITVYTTRPDTLFGATYMVLAPEHPLVEKITTAEQLTAVCDYQKTCASKSDIERTELNKEKSGVFTGTVCTEKSALFSGEGIAKNSGFLDGMPTAKAKTAMIEWLETHKKGQSKTNYKLRDWLFSRQRYWGEPFPIVWENGQHKALDDSELPLLQPELEDFRPVGDPRVGFFVSGNACEPERKVEQVIDTVRVLGCGCVDFFKLCLGKSTTCRWVFCFPEISILQQRLQKWRGLALA